MFKNVISLPRLDNTLSEFGCLDAPMMQHRVIALQVKSHSNRQRQNDDQGWTPHGFSHSRGFTGLGRVGMEAASK